MPRYIEKIEKLTLPVVPLRGLVAFPALPLNFELVRDISISACNAAADADMYIFLVAQKDIETKNQGITKSICNSLVNSYLTLGLILV